MCLLARGRMLVGEWYQLQFQGVSLAASFLWRLKFAVIVSCPVSAGCCCCSCRLADWLCTAAGSLLMLLAAGASGWFVATAVLLAAAGGWLQLVAGLWQLIGW